MKRTEEELKILSDILYSDLEQGFELKCQGLINPFRQCSKTYTLVKFAKDKGLPLLVGKSRFAAMLKEQYQYDKIYSYKDVNSFWTYKTKGVIVDNEGVDLEFLKQAKVKIVGGYI
jgi:hypothetical protein